MILEWFNAGDASKIGVALADQFTPPQTSSARPAKKAAPKEPADALLEILHRADHEVRSLRLNFYKKAKLANAFKWRLLENGFEKTKADEVTQRLVMLLSENPATSALDQPSAAQPTHQLQSTNTKQLLALGNKSIARGAYAEAIDIYQRLIKVDPRHAAALNNLGAALSKLGRFVEAEAYFHQAIRVDADFPDAYSNIGTTLLLKGLYEDAESFLRRALKLNPRLVEARINLGLALAFLSRLRDAKSNFEKALKYDPRNAEALVGMALIAKTQGSFDQAEAMLERALKVNPGMSKALASQVSIRKMTSSDNAWLESAEKAAGSGINLLDESELRFAIGKYYDDIESFKLAFGSYKLANDLLKSIAEPYDRGSYKGFVDRMIDAYTPKVLGRVEDGASVSMKPVFVVGMPRSGTSLTEQIISSHPLARGAGELEFWGHAAREHEATLGSPLDESTRRKLAEAYLKVLEVNAGGALRIVDKAPVNADYLGLIHSVFPNARIIYMQRDPIDTCLSCYFQKFVLSLTYTMDLSDLADHYRQHERLMAHWRAVLPPGTMLDIPYEQMVADQEGWSRKILDFVGLEWDQRVLDFHTTKRSVVTASFWQVRQKIYQNSVRRWRHYEKFIGPLLDLKNPAR